MSVWYALKLAINIHSLEEALHRLQLIIIHEHREKYSSQAGNRQNFRETNQYLERKKKIKLALSPRIIFIFSE